VSEHSLRSDFFLDRRFAFLLTLAVIATTLFSWFNVNSCLILLLLLYRLLAGKPILLLATAFSNVYFLTFFSLFLLEAAGLLYTQDRSACWKYVESKATLVAIPFILCAGPFTDYKGYRRLLSAYSLLLAGCCLYCLTVACIRNYQLDRIGVFFYHDLTSAIGVNAVFFSGYVIVALLFLLNSPLEGPVTLRVFRIGLLAFFSAMMILLASKLLLVLLFVILFYWLIHRFRTQREGRQVIVLGVLILLGTGALAFTDNPVARRYRDILNEEDYGAGLHAASHVHFNGVSLRLLIWKDAFVILNEQHAWLLGVTAGDSHRLLNQKFIDARMSRGYLNYNFHNQYIELLVHSGLPGCALFLLTTGLLFRLARRQAVMEAWFTIAMVVVMALTQSTFEMQHPVFLSCFFPLLLLYGRRSGRLRVSEKI
jgi:O-antigen ligase